MQQRVIECDECAAVVVVVGWSVRRSGAPSTIKASTRRVLVCIPFASLRLSVSTQHTLRFAHTRRTTTHKAHAGRFQTVLQSVCGSLSACKLITAFYLLHTETHTQCPSSARQSHRTSASTRVFCCVHQIATHPSHERPRIPKVIARSTQIAFETKGWWDLNLFSICVVSGVYLHMIVNRV